MTRITLALCLTLATCTAPAPAQPVPLGTSGALEWVLGTYLHRVAPALAPDYADAQADWRSSRPSRSCRAELRRAHYALAEIAWAVGQLATHAPHQPPEDSAGWWVGQMLRIYSGLGGVR